MHNEVVKLRKCSFGAQKSGRKLITRCRLYLRAGRKAEFHCTTLKCTTVLGLVSTPSSLWLKHKTYPFMFFTFLFRSAPEEGLYCKPKYRAKLFFKKSKYISVILAFVACSIKLVTSAVGISLPLIFCFVKHSFKLFPS